MLVVLHTLLPQARLNSSVLAMLPKQALGAIPPALNDGFMQRLDRQLVWLVSPGKQADPLVARDWLTRLQRSGALAEVKGPMDARSQQAWGTFFWQHRNGMIDSETRQRLQNGGEAQAQWILSQLYSAFSGVSGKELQNDPLMLTRGSQLAMAKNGQRLRLMDGWLVTQDSQGNYWYLLHGELAGSSFDMQQTHKLVTTLGALEKTFKAQYPQVRLLSRGTVFYSDYASQQAKHDVSTLGLATVLGVLLLILVVFRSVRPILLCLLSIAIGALAGTVVTLLVFGELHLMTLVMSMSIIGISADYTLYYLHRAHGAWRRYLALAEPGESPQCAAAGPADHGGRLSDHDAGTVSGHSPDGALCGGGPERRLPDGRVLASVAVPRLACASGPRHGADAALACRMAA